MIKRNLIVFLIVCNNTAFSLNSIPDSILNKCNTAQNIKYLTKDEKQVIMYVNLARCYPQLFLENLAKPFILTSSYKQSDPYVVSLIKELKNALPIDLLYVDKKLCEIARDFVKMQGPSGKSGHNISNRYLDGENIDYGSDTPLETAMSLLIDQGVQSLGHRRYILSPEYRFIGVSIGYHKIFSTFCVMDFKR